MFRKDQLIRFSCADYAFPTLTRLQTLSLLKLLEFDFIDIGLFARSNHYSPAQHVEAGDAYARQVRSELDAAELSAGDVFLQIGPEPHQCAVNDLNPLVRKENHIAVDRALEFCTAIGCSHLTGLPGVFQSGSHPDRDLALAAEETIWRLEQCAAAGIQYSIEPHIGSICPDLESTLAFLKNVSGLTLTLDYGHFIYSGQMSEEVHRLLPAASHIHVRGGATGRLQTSVRENEIDFTGMLRQLNRLSYEGLLALEYVWIDWQDCNRSDNIAETTLLRRDLQTAMQQIDKEDRDNHV